MLAEEVVAGDVVLKPREVFLFDAPIHCNTLCRWHPRSQLVDLRDLLFFFQYLL